MTARGVTIHRDDVCVRRNGCGAPLPHVTSRLQSALWRRFLQESSFSLRNGIVAAPAVALCLLAAVGAGGLLWSLLPPGRYPILIAIAPAVPFLLIAAWIAQRAGWDRIFLPDWLRWAVKPVAFIGFVLLFLWLFGDS
jgi:hypothetical protein